ncbi:uncharacterized protein LOC109712035 isoform X2 [Ananas comosus]|uniref:Uncharacterized protein LOC109712035 isoform X2 n=1 Tax=Ananas comosus TaxID=4615 RepID=A0A6P5F4Y6_ANACO|nr:uncharacterized protein LOC109712035 isoform X2 [Ananas comosus]
MVAMDVLLLSVAETLAISHPQAILRRSPENHHLSGAGPAAPFPKPTRRSFPRLVAASARAAAAPWPSPSSAGAGAASPPPSSSGPASTKWVVVMEKPPAGGSSRAEVVDYYVETLARVLGSEKEAQMCIYDASWQTNYGFCCEIDEASSQELARMPGVLSVKPDRDEELGKKDYGNLNLSFVDQLESNSSPPKFSPSTGRNEYWLVQMEKPGVEVVTKAQMVDHYTQILTKVLGNEKDAQVSIYNISWEKDFGFCCHVDKECARELADHGNSPKTSETNQLPDVKTKRLFVTGLSFYTSEKTLRAAFEGFGELIEVKIIMDKISKRSKGYAFIEYTTEEAAGAALREMNGKIINGWMIVVDVARTNPPKYSRGRPRPSSPSASSY